VKICHPILILTLINNPPLGKRLHGRHSSCFAPFYDSIQPRDNELSQSPLFVATNSFKSQQNSCKSPKVALPLHRRKETDDKVNNKNNKYNQLKKLKL
jgi:hypothetical protein